MSTLKVNKLRDTSGSADAITLDPNGGAVLAGVTTMTTARVTSGIVTNTFIVGAGVTISESGIEASGIGITCANINGGQFSNRNIIVNGAMEVDQRNAGVATATTLSSSFFAADRMRVFLYGCGELAASLQRVEDAPAGFHYSNKVTITTPESTGGTPAADDRFSMQNRIEGHDINRLSLGTSGAKDFVISFYVKASTAGNYGLAVVNSSGSRSYCMLYAATTSWSRVVLKVPGDTSGTYSTSNSEGLALKFGLYNGSSRSGPDQGIAGTGTWQSSSSPQGTTGQTQLGGINSATWQITGLQLEAGTEATPFEFRNIADEVKRCSRYFQQYDGGSNSLFATGFTAGNDFYGGNTLPMGKMRTTPSIAVTGTLSHLNYTHVAVSANVSSLTNQGSGDSSFVVRLQSTTNTTSNAGAYARLVNSNTNLEFRAEL